MTGVTSERFTAVETLTVDHRSALETIRAEARTRCSSDRTLCFWSADPPAVPGVYTVTASATDATGNVEDPGPAPNTVVVT